MKIKSSLITKGNFLRPMYVAGARNNKNGSVDREGRGHAQGKRTFTNLRFLQPEKTADISRRHGWFPRRMTFEKWVQKFHTDDVSLARSGKCLWLVGNLINPIRSTTQNYIYPEPGSDASSVWNFCLVSQTSFRGETAGGVAKRQLFSQVRILGYSHYS